MAKRLSPLAAAVLEVLEVQSSGYLIAPTAAAFTAAARRPETDVQAAAADELQQPAAVEAALAELEQAGKVEQVELRETFVVGYEAPADPDDDPVELTDELVTAAGWRLTGSK